MDREKVINGINKILEETDEYDGVLWDALTLLKEQEAAYQGAVELLRQKTILFDDAIKRLKEQETEIAFLKAMQLQTVHNMSNEDIGNAVRDVLRL